MVRRRSNRPLVPGAGSGLDWLKVQTMKDRGYTVDTTQPDQVKFEVARNVGVPLEPGYNGNLTTESAGKVGGPIGGAMVRELVRMAQLELVKQRQENNPE